MGRAPRDATIDLASVSTETLLAELDRLVDAWTAGEAPRRDEPAARALIEQLRIGHERLYTRLDEILSPRSCAVYAPVDGDLVPVVVAGTDGGVAAPDGADRLDAAIAADGADADLAEPLIPVLPGDAPLMHVLATRDAPLDVGEWLRAANADARTVETLDAAVVVPVRRTGALDNL